MTAFFKFLSCTEIDFINFECILVQEKIGPLCHFAKGSIGISPGNNPYFKIGNHLYKIDDNKITHVAFQDIHEVPTLKWLPDGTLIMRTKMELKQVHLLESQIQIADLDLQVREFCVLPEGTMLAIRKDFRSFSYEFPSVRDLRRMTSTSGRLSGFDLQYIQILAVSLPTLSVDLLKLVANYVLEEGLQFSASIALTVPVQCDVSLQLSEALLKLYKQLEYQISKDLSNPRFSFASSSTVESPESLVKQKMALGFLISLLNKKKTLSLCVSEVTAQFPAEMSILRDKIPALGLSLEDLIPLSPII